MVRFLVSFPSPEGVPPFYGLTDADFNLFLVVSLGKPASAALEKLCSQTQVFLDAAAAKAGGKAGLINVREDFLRPSE
jgi:hypothetical protein